MNPAPPRLDLLRLPLLGAFLRWRHARTALQGVLLAVAVLVVVDGFWGPPQPSRNAAGTLPWVQWRGLVVVALLGVGNLFCMACPFMLPRRLAKRWSRPARPVPSWLKGKWAAVVVLAVFFWAYEALDLWASPAWTAWVVIGYFVMAFAVDALFRGAVFCKHLCPIGQFHFVHTPLSPFEVAVRDVDRCASCATKDCIRGRWTPGTSGAQHEVPLQRGCELWLYQPRKVGNLDCTFCMECIHACPHDNVGILSRTPGAELTVDPVRSGVGRLGQRSDLAALAAVMVFAALVNALGMVQPFVRLQERVAEQMGVGTGSVLAGALLLTLVALPGATIAAAASWERTVTRTASQWRRFVWGWVPLGLSMWAAHHLFHFVLGSSALRPLLSRLTSAAPAAAALPAATAMEVPTWVFAVQCALLTGGLLWTLHLLGRIGRDACAERHGAAAVLPWRLVALLLFLISIWLLAQPMEMRGALGG
ncbi:MAG: FesM [Gemmatimonadota bacterium]